jgi:hypothetical protein
LRGSLQARPGKGEEDGKNKKHAHDQHDQHDHGSDGHDRHGNSDHKGSEKPHTGDGYVIGLSSSTRRDSSHAKGNVYDFKYARVEYGKLPKHVRPCDDLRKGKHGEYVDMCIEADLLAHAPKHTYVSGLDSAPSWA